MITVASRIQDNLDAVPTSVRRIIRTMAPVVNREKSGLPLAASPQHAVSGGLLSRKMAP